MAGMNGGENMATDEEIWNEDGTPRPEAVATARQKLREILENEYEWNQNEIDDFMSKTSLNEWND